MDYIEKLDIQTEDVKEVESLEKHTIINEPISVNKYNGHTREFLAVEGDYNDGFNKLNETVTLGVSCNVSKKVNELRTSLENIVSYNKLNRKCKAKFGIAPWWVKGTTRNKIESDIIKNKSIGCEEMPIIVHVGFKDNFFYTEEDINDMVFAYEKCKKNGIKINMIKFHIHLIKNDVLLTNLDRFKTYWKNEIEKWALTFKDLNIPYFTIMNELKTIYNNPVYDDFVVECLQIPKRYGFKVGISTMGINECFNFSEIIHNTVDCYFNNVYPVVSYNMDKTTKKESIDAWNVHKMMSRELFKRGKPLIMSETGIQDRFMALSNSGRYDWYDLDPTPTQGKVSTLFLYGLFESGILDYYENVIYWYFDSLWFENCKQIIKEYTGVI